MKKNMPKMRLIANIILTFFINLMLRNNATEYFSGFRGIRVQKLKEIKLNNFSNKWIIEQQIHFYFIIKKYKVTEIHQLFVKKIKFQNHPFNYVFQY